MTSGLVALTLWTMLAPPLPGAAGGPPPAAPVDLLDEEGIAPEDEELTVGSALLATAVGTAAAGAVFVPFLVGVAGASLWSTLGGDAALYGPLTAWALSVGAAWIGLTAAVGVAALTGMVFGPLAEPDVELRHLGIVVCGALVAPVAVGFLTLAGLALGFGGGAVPIYSPPPSIDDQPADDGKDEPPFFSRWSARVFVPATLVWFLGIAGTVAGTVAGVAVFVYGSEQFNVPVGPEAAAALAGGPVVGAAAGAALGAVIGVPVGLALGVGWRSPIEEDEEELDDAPPEPFRPDARAPDRGRGAQGDPADNDEPLDPAEDMPPYGSRH